jgi:membrane dipeptidase
MHVDGTRSPRSGPEAAELHARSFVADTHNDLLTLVVRRPPERWAGYFGDHWLPQLRAGGLDLQVLSVFVDSDFRPEGALRETLRMVEAAHRTAEGLPDDVVLCRDGEDVAAAHRTGRLALVLALEGCPQIDDDVELLQTMFRLGVRMVSFAHFGRSALADGSSEDAAGSRLTTSGVEAFRLVQQLGILFDVSHLGLAGVDHVLELASRPVVASHSCARAVYDHHRNLSDHHLRGIAATGGVVSVSFYAGYIAVGTPTIEQVVDHIEHVVDVAGVDAVGLGSDFVKECVEDGTRPCDRPVTFAGTDAEVYVPGLEGPAGFPDVTSALLRRGFAGDDVAKILGGNVARLFAAELGRPMGARDDAGDRSCAGLAGAVPRT